MSIDWTDAKTWHDERGPAAGLLSKLRKDVTSQADLAQAVVLAELIDFLRLQRRGVGHLFDVVAKVTKYNEASHAQQTRQMEAVQTLIDLMKEQGRQLKDLTRRIESIEKRVEKLATSR